MEPDSTMLQAAISEVEKERSYLSAELEAFQVFREAVRLATPEPKNIDGSLATSEQLRETYREEVMNGFDHRLFYGDSLRASLEHELSPAIADTLLSNEPLTQRRKRDLLVETTEAIKQREEFLEELDEERAALETFADELSDIESTLEELPVCSVQRQSLERLLRVWDQYETLENDCETLLERRQEELRRDDRFTRAVSDRHARNEYLYRELETSYPVLGAIAETIERIDSNRLGEEVMETMDGPKTL